MVAPRAPITLTPSTNARRTRLFTVGLQRDIAVHLDHEPLPWLDCDGGWDVLVATQHRLRRVGSHLPRRRSHLGDTQGVRGRSRGAALVERTQKDCGQKRRTVDL